MYSVHSVLFKYKVDQLFRHVHERAELDCLAENHKQIGHDGHEIT